MKTAVSVPDDVFERAERLARTAGRSRSDVYSAALREYVARHEADDVTEAVNRVVEDLGEDAAADEFVQEAARRVLEASEW
ncbi:MAG: ribbon-helix-helix protein, CopG family [Chloroflexi bacterium]|nr:ribbon-helix-helix protein, CopG family [Chloroflexota bacterium]